MKLRGDIKLHDKFENVSSSSGSSDSSISGKFSDLQDDQKPPNDPKEEEKKRTKSHTKPHATLMGSCALFDDTIANKQTTELENFPPTTQEMIHQNQNRESLLGPTGLEAIDITLSGDVSASADIKNQK